MPFEGLFLQRVAGVFFINVFLEQIKNLLQTLSPPSHAGGTWMFPTLLQDSTPGHGGNYPTVLTCYSALPTGSP